jgi:hypothetical protein
VVLGATGGVISCDGQPSNSDVVHDHIRLRHHHIGAITCFVVRIRARHVEHPSTTVGSETVGGSTGRGQLSPSGRSAEMISDGRSDTDRKVLIKGVGKNLLPTTQALGCRRPGPPVAAPDTGNRHIDLFATSFQVRP